MYEALRDELYCQVMKQTTSNKSSIPDSCQRGWRLFSIIAAYFTCSDILRPYLFKYLETNAYDKRRAFHGEFLYAMRYNKSNCDIVVCRIMSELLEIFLLLLFTIGVCLIDVCYFLGTAMVSLQNLRKTFKYGGRKNVPSVDEITALTAGRNSKREIYRLPGGTERVINTRSTSVVQVLFHFIYVSLLLIFIKSDYATKLYCVVNILLKMYFHKITFLY